jgi:hypothetical protein
MGTLFGTFRTALRAAVWKPTPEPPLLGLPGLLVVVIAAFGVEIATQYVSAGTPARFNPYGLNALLAWTTIGLVIAALFVRSPGRLTFLAGMMMITAIPNLLNIASALTLPTNFWDTHKIGLWTNDDTRTLFFIVELIWWVGALIALLRSVDPNPCRSRVLRVAGLYAVTLIAGFAVPHDPVFRGRDFDRRIANYWEYIPAVLHGEFEHDKEPPPRRVNGARVELAQPALMDEAVARLAPQTKGRTDIYAIGIAGWAEQDVFVKELDGALASAARSLPIADRIMRLVNHVDTVGQTPVATRNNFAAAVHAMARVMDRDEDVLLLFLTSHGSPDGFALRLPGLISTGLTPADLASVLDREGIKNRIVVVSACYAGVFIKPLANDDTIVLTAADEKSTSFGCSNEREWTYFGDAFFNRSLRPDASIEEAFLDARMLIGQWEARDGLHASNPQAHFGRSLTGKLERLRAGGRDTALNAP